MGDLEATGSSCTANLRSHRCSYTQLPWPEKGKRWKKAPRQILGWLELRLWGKQVNMESKSPYTLLTHFLLSPIYEIYRNSFWVISRYICLSHLAGIFTEGTINDSCSLPASLWNKFLLLNFHVLPKWRKLKQRALAIEFVPGWPCRRATSV